ncbi:MAG TPA: Na+/H+ antiporter subunit E [Acidimicrobiia bacterium]
MPGRTWRAGAWLQRFVLLLVLWLVLTSTVLPDEVVTGVIAAVIGATVWQLATSRDGMVLRFDAAWLRWVAALPRRIVVDTWLVTRALVGQLRGRSMRGEMCEVAFMPITDRAERDAHQAVVAILVSMSPNHYVVDLDEDRGVATLHLLVPKPASTLADVLAGS